MTGSNGVLSVPNEHPPGLVALVLVGPVVWTALARLRALAARRVPGAGSVAAVSSEPIQHRRARPEA